MGSAGPARREWVAAGRAIGGGLRGIVGIVGDTHDAVARRVESLLPPTAAPVMAVERSIAAGVNAVVGVAHEAVPAALGLAAGALAPTDAPPPCATPVGRALLPVANAFWGDHLEDRHAPLAIPTAVRIAGSDLAVHDHAAVAAALPDATEHVVVFVHGLLADERWWELPMDESGATYLSRLRDEHDLTGLAVRYNSGRRISHNGAELARLLESLVVTWPVPLASLAIVGHSMGGLVARSAAHQANELGHAWVRRLRALVTLGSPHLGAPLERGAHVADRALRVLPESAPVGRPLATRSVGIKDLRYGAILDADWLGHDPDELLRDRCTPAPPLPHVAHHWVATTLTREPGHRVGHVLGDGLVRTTSARGVGRRRSIGLPADAGAELGGVHHLRQVHHPGVYDHLAAWLAPAAGGGAAV